MHEPVIGFILREMLENQISGRSINSSHLISVQREAENNVY